MPNQHNSVYIIVQPINEAGGVVKGGGVGSVSNQLINKLDKLVNVTDNRKSLTNIEKLPKEYLMLISAEAFVDHSTKCSPVGLLEATLH